MLSRVARSALLPKQHGQPSGSLGRQASLPIRASDMSVASFQALETILSQAHRVRSGLACCMVLKSIASGHSGTLDRLCTACPAESFFCFQNVFGGITQLFWRFPSGSSMSVEAEKAEVSQLPHVLCAQLSVCLVWLLSRGTMADIW